MWCIQGHVLSVAIKCYGRYLWCIQGHVLSVAIKCYGRYLWCIQGHVLSVAIKCYSRYLWCIQGHVLSVAIKCKVILLVIYTLRRAAPFVHEVVDDNKRNLRLSERFARISLWRNCGAPGEHGVHFENHWARRSGVRPRRGVTYFSVHQKP